MNILEYEKLSLFTEMSNDLEATLTEILVASPKFSSYKLAQDTVKSLFNHQGKSRQDYFPDEGNWDEDDPNDEIISTMDEELYKVLISEINIFIKGLEENGEPSANKLKALVIKFLNTNLYINFPDLYKPKEYEDLIEELLDLPSRFKNYYLNVIDEVEIMNPESPLIPKLKELGNGFLLMDAGSSTELRTVSQQERDLITRHRKALKKLISPDIVYLRERLNLPHTTYVYSISKVINELSTRLEEDELMSRFSKIILS